MGSPSGGRGSPRERDRNSTGRSGSSKRRRGRGEGGRGGRGGGRRGRGRERGERGRLGGGCVEQREQWEGPLATQPDREIELNQTSRGAGRVCVGVVPRV